MHGPLGDLLSRIEGIIEPQTSEGYYEAFVPAGTVSLNENTFIAVTFTLDFEDDDWLPDFAREHHLEGYSDILLMQDVIGNVRAQKQDPAIAEFVAALNYFYKHDAFLEFDMNGDSG